MRALIVDDSRAMRHMLKRIVGPLGFEVAEAGNGLEGLERLKEYPDAELALVDWNMPEMNGFEFVKAVRAETAYSELKIIMVTTETEPTKMARALMAGADEFLMKPFTPEMLVDKLNLIGIPISSVA